MSTNLSSSAELPCRICGEAEDIIIVLEHKVLGVSLLVQNHSNSSRVVDNSTALSVLQVVSSVVTTIAIEIFKLERGIRTLAVERRRNIACWPHALCCIFRCLLSAERFLLDKASLLILLDRKINPVLGAFSLRSRFSSCLNAFTFEVRIVEEVGSVSHVLP